MTGDRVPVTVVELPDFSALAERLWSPEEREEFVDFIARNPETGKIIAATGGVRKVRWGRKGMGSRGGVRVIYYFFDESVPLLLMTLFAKNERDDLGEDDKRDLRAFTKAFKAARRQQ